MTEEQPMSINQERLAKVTALESGAHTPNGRWCIMEAAAFVAGEPWSDHPECVSPVIGAFMRNWNDNLPDDERTALLLPLLPKLLNTRGSTELEQRRSLMAADWLVRTHTVAWLRLAKLDKQADLLANLPEITSMAQIPSILGPLKAVRIAADASRAAWEAAAEAAAGAAEAAWADWAAAAAAWEAAAWAAREAAGAAPVNALKATKTKLQQSAVVLVERMCALKDEP